jgi:multidrug resistance efflux pump
LPLQSDFEQAKANLLMASGQENDASLHYTDYGSARKARERMSYKLQEVSQKDAALRVSSPISGTVITPRITDLLGTYLNEGQKFLEVADLSLLRARIYISEYDLYKIENDAKARLQVEGIFKIWAAQIGSVATRPTELDESLAGKSELAGMNPPHFYVVDLFVQNSEGTLRPGMTGVARVYGKHRSALGLAWETLSDFFGRKIW